MKKQFFLLMLAAQAAVAAPIETSRVIKDETTLIALELTSDSVFCTDRGYGNVQLKVSVPELDHLAHFDHRVVGERLPCITGGACSDVLKPDAILDAKEKIAVVPVQVILTEKIRLDRESATCTRSLHELVKSHIRGRNFVHVRGDGPTPLAVDLCEKLIGL